MTCPLGTRQPPLQRCTAPIAWASQQAGRYGPPNWACSVLGGGSVHLCGRGRLLGVSGALPSALAFRCRQRPPRVSRATWPRPVRLAAPSRHADTHTPLVQTLSICCVGCLASRHCVRASSPVPCTVAYPWTCTPWSMATSWFEGTCSGPGLALPHLTAHGFLQFSLLVEDTNTWW